MLINRDARDELARDLDGFRKSLLGKPVQ
jgi:hypothetical protein